MRKFSLVEFSVDHPKPIVALSIIITLVFMTQFPKVRTDTNPKKVLPPTSAVRVGNDDQLNFLHVLSDSSKGQLDAEVQQIMQRSVIKRNLHEEHL